MSEKFSGEIQNRSIEFYRTPTEKIGLIEVRGGNSDGDD